MQLRSLQKMLQFDIWHITVYQGCTTWGPLDLTENESILAHNCLSYVNDDASILLFSCTWLPDGPYYKTICLPCDLYSIAVIGCIKPG